MVSITESYRNGDLHEVQVDQEDVENLPNYDKTRLRIEYYRAQKRSRFLSLSGTFLFRQLVNNFPLQPVQILLSLTSLISSILDNKGTTTQQRLE